MRALAVLPRPIPAQLIRSTLVVAVIFWSLVIGAQTLGRDLTLLPRADQALTQEIHMGPARFALVIGNGTYDRRPDHPWNLPKAINDANDMGEALARLGFHVEGAIDATPARFVDAFARLERRLGDAPAGDRVVVFYYAGHGVGDPEANRNMLLPVGVNYDGYETIRRQARDVQWVINRLKSAGATSVIMILDACRNWPQEARSLVPGLAGRGLGSNPPGFIETKPSRGTFIAYAVGFGERADVRTVDTRTGRVTEHDPRNGLFTKTLLSHIAEPGISIYDLFHEVGTQVSELSGQRENPTFEGQMYGVRPFSFVPVTAIAGSTIVRTAPPAESEQKTKNLNLAPSLAAGTPAVGGATGAPTQAGQTFRDCAECPEMVVIPAGSFLMGQRSLPERGPVHQVSVRSFLLGKFEVTQGQWKALMGSDPSSIKMCGDDCPVEQVSWDDAKEFVKRLSAKTLKAYRLASEAEWEYACQASGRYQNACGSDNVDTVAQPFSTQFKKYRVGGKSANAFGVYDMSGNVGEWVEDCYNISYRGAPRDGSAWTSENCGLRVLRGEHSVKDPFHRIGSQPWNHSYSIGFRVALSAARKN